MIRSKSRLPAAAPILTLVASLLAGCATGGAGSQGPGLHGGTPGATMPSSPQPAIEAAGVQRSPGAPPADIRVFHGDGTPASWTDLLEASASAEVLLLGEIHDDRVGHQTRHALLESLAGDSCAPHVISLEMLESDVQLVVDEYQAGIITRDHFMRAARPWPNHADDYEPYLAEARRCGFPVVASNPPRRYVNRVARLGTAGLDALDPQALTLLPPLPVAPPTDRYRAAWNALMGGASGGGGHGAAPATAAHGAAPHPTPEARPEDPVLKAQNLWDAGMAWAVAESLRAHPEARVIHVAGAFHVQDFTGIPDHLTRYAPDARTLVMVAYPVDRDAPFDPEAHGGKGDFVVLTYRP